LQGDPSLEFYILLEGELEVILVDEARLLECTSEDSKKEFIAANGRTIATLNGRLVNFGEMGPLLGQARTATIRAKTRAVVQSIPATGEGFSNTILQNPDLGLNVAITVAKRLLDTINGIEKYDRILFQLDTILSSVNKIYQEIIQQLKLRFEASGDRILSTVYDRLKAARLGNPVSKEFIYQPIPPGLSTPTVLSESDPIFSGMELHSINKGDILPFQDQSADYIYLLYEGTLGLFYEGEAIQSFSKRGDLCGLIKALSTLELQYRQIGESQFQLKALTPAKIARIEALFLQENAQSCPHLILHVCRILAEQLRSYHHQQTEALSTVETKMNLLSHSSDSCEEELRKVLNYFFENQQWFSTCLAEILTLKETQEKIESDAMQLRDCLRISFANPFAIPLLKLGKHD
jgi:CRP-like cAMP-binding protein